MEKVSVFWFRRDLRLEDNRALFEALKGDYPVLPLFVFDTEITDDLAPDDPRINFIYDTLNQIHSRLVLGGGGVLCLKGTILDAWSKIIQQYDVQQVFANEDYEPYALQRDQEVEHFLSCQGIPFSQMKDQVIMAKNDVLKNDGTPYTVFTPYKNKWLQSLQEQDLADFSLIEKLNFAHIEFNFPTLEELGFERSKLSIRPYTLAYLDSYEKSRDFPALDQTSYLGVHLRFGTVSVRQLVREVKDHSVFLSELIWREFFMQIIYHFPKVVAHNFKAKYDGIDWRNKPDEFEQWKRGETGYPLVDAGIRELNATGYMHNRVRMVVAGFLCKHLLIDWRWGEAYFAEKLMDYELASNNANWQWAAGTGCDAAPYFRVFNPMTQAKKFDPQGEYISQWVPEYGTPDYPEPMVDHKMARERAIAVYKQGLL